MIDPIEVQIDLVAYSTINGQCGPYARVLQLSNATTTAVISIIFQAFDDVLFILVCVLGCLCVCARACICIYMAPLRKMFQCLRWLIQNCNIVFESESR